MLKQNAKEGTRPVAGLRPAVLADLGEIERLLVDAGLPIDGVADSLANFIVAGEGGAIIAAGGLEVVDDDALLRSVVVASEARGTGLGNLLVLRLLADAREKGLATVWLLTETAESFFPRFGFRKVARDDAPVGLASTAEFLHCCPASATVMARRVRPLSVLILCTANTARSQMAEALFRHSGGDLLQVASAGSTPGTGPHPLAVTTLSERGIDWSGKRSKGLQELGSDWDMVITVCDQARDACPIVPGKTAVHWGLPDPAGTPDEVKAFAETARALEARIEQLLMRPWAVMDTLEIARDAAEIHDALS